MAEVRFYRFPYVFAGFVQVYYYYFVGIRKFAIGFHTFSIAFTTFIGAIYVFRLCFPPQTSPNLQTVLRIPKHLPTHLPSELTPPQRTKTHLFYLPLEGNRALLRKKSHGKSYTKFWILKGGYMGEPLLPGPCTPPV